MYAIFMVTSAPKQWSRHMLDSVSAAVPLIPQLDAGRQSRRAPMLTETPVAADREHDFGKRPLLGGGARKSGGNLIEN